MTQAEVQRTIGVVTHILVGRPNIVFCGCRNALIGNLGHSPQTVSSVRICIDTTADRPTAAPSHPSSVECAELVLHHQAAQFVELRMESKLDDRIGKTH